MLGGHVSKETSSMIQLSKQIQLIPEEYIRLINLACEVLECEHDSLKNEISIRAKGSIETSFGSLYSTPLNIIKKIVLLKSIPKAADGQAKNISALLDTHDIRNNVYEGGFKVWEGAKDLISFLDSTNLIGSELETKGELNILEVGAGAALPIIFCLTKLMKENRPNQIFNVHIQDFNEEVLNYLVLMNLGINLGSNTIIELLRSSKIKAFYGPWSDYCSDLRYDVIIMSETIYNIESYNSLHNLLVRHLKQDGVVILATKDTYFGCTGSLFEWEDFINEKKNLFISSIIKPNNLNIPRSILTMKVRKTND